MTTPTFEQIRDRLERAVIAQIDALTEIPARDKPDYPPRVFLMRRGANSARLWQGCAHAACRRTRQCRRMHGQCLARASEIARSHRAWLFARGKFDRLLKLAGRQK